MKINDAIFGAFFLLLGIVVLVHVQGFSRIPGQQVGPGLFPGIIAAGFALCGIALIINGIRSREKQPWTETADWMRSGRHVVALAAIVGGVAAYIFLAESVGFLIVAPLLLWLWLAVLGVRTKTAIIVAVVATLLIWYAFYKVLRVPLPWGVLTGMAF